MNALAAWLALTMAWAPALAQDSTWQDHDRAARDARARGDWGAARGHYVRMDSIVGGHPNVVLALARASAAIGDTTAAVAQLQRLTRMGVTANLAADSILRLLGEAKPDVARHLAGNISAVGASSIEASFADPRFILEGVAWDAKHQSLLISTISHGTIVRASARGGMEPFIDLVRDGAWSGLAVVVDAPRNRLWVTSKYYPLLKGSSPSDTGKTAILRYDLTTGALQRRFDLPRGNHEPGDACVAGNGDFFVSDGAAGSISVIRAGSDALVELVKPGPLVSPQGCAVDEATGQLFVADYLLGIMAVHRASGAVTRVARSPDVAVNGIDGLVLRGRELVGVQNGVVPDRVVAMELDRTGRAIRAVRVLHQDTTVVREPTHLTVVNDDIVFVANGGFDLYERTGALRAGAVPIPTRIRRITQHSALTRPSSGTFHPTQSATAQLFAPGIISTHMDEFSGTFSPDGREFYFGVSVPRSHHYVICFTRQEQGRWSTPRVVSFSGRYRDFDPMMSPDGQRIYFISDRPVDGQPRTDYDVWMVERRGTYWSPPRNLGAPVNTSAHELRAVEVRDGSLYFSSGRPGGLGNHDIYRAPFTQGAFGEPVNLGPEINSAADEVEVTITPDEELIAIAVFGRPDALGSQDIYVSRKSSGKWIPSHNAGPIVNSSARDYSPSLSRDGKELLFTSERGGPRVEAGRQWTYGALHGTPAILNGWGNIYRVNIAALGLKEP